jgi:hypothetical protein
MMPSHPPLIRLLVLALAIVAACLSAASAGSTPRNVTPGTWCGGSLWRLMTLSDPQRHTVDLRGHSATIKQISSYPKPVRTPSTRRTWFQRHVFRMRTVVDRYRIASNGEIVLILYNIDSAQYMNAYLPNPHCLGPRARDRTGMIAARKQLTDHCPAPTAQWQLVGWTVDIGGVGFWNPTNMTRGALPTGAELRPVTNFKIVDGCGIG